MAKQYRKLFVIFVIALFLAACGGGGTSLLVAPSEDAAMNTDSPDNTSDEDTDKSDGSDTSETQDTDGDGVGDNSDAFPNDPLETLDSDSDGVGDNSDAFPDDASETLDSDGDGTGDNVDAFPNDASETLDSDSDGVGDNSDAFPHDPLETVDTDNDGTGDNNDAFPNDASETLDSDGDGVGDNSDAFPENPSESLDSDGEIGVLLMTNQSGVPAERVINYLKNSASGGPWQSGPNYTYTHSPGLVRFSIPPTVSLAQGADNLERAIFHYAVSLLNRALPYDQHLVIDPNEKFFNYENFDHYRDWLKAIPDGEIVVEFVSEPPRGGRPGSRALAHSDVSIIFDAEQERWEKDRRRAGAVEMDSAEFRDRPDHQAVSVLVHELTHVLGFAGHVPGDEFPDSNNFTAWSRLDGSLPAIDAAALQALYTRLGERLEEDDLSPDSLGAWSRETIHLDGRIDWINFGVSHNNGISMPWTRGPEPDRALVDNSNLQGTASWAGGLLGFTPELQSVGGIADLSIDLDTMSGSADFTELQMWPTEMSPGKLGTGLIWNTGKLAYDITVGGNYFYSTGGDDGTVNGQFYGNDHEGVAGSLERQDLTASFGAVGTH